MILISALQKGAKKELVSFFSFEAQDDSLGWGEQKANQPAFWSNSPHPPPRIVVPQQVWDSAVWEIRRTWLPADHLVVTPKPPLPRTLRCVQIKIFHSRRSEEDSQLISYQSGVASEGCK